MSTMDLGSVLAAGERAKKAGALVDGMVAGGQQVLDTESSPVIAFLVVEHGNEDLSAGALRAALAAAVLRLAAR